WLAGAGRPPDQVLGGRPEPPSVDRAAVQEAPQRLVRVHGHHLVCLAGFRQHRADHPPVCRGSHHNPRTAGREAFGEEAPSAGRQLLVISVELHSVARHLALTFFPPRSMSYRHSANQTHHRSLMSAVTSSLGSPWPCEPGAYGAPWKSMVG